MGLIGLYFLTLLSAFMSVEAFATQLKFPIEENIVQPLSLTKVSDMQFPNILQGFSGAVNATDTLNGSTGYNASINISGEPLETFRVTGTDSGMVLSGTGGSINVALNVSGSGFSNGVGTLDGSGARTLTISGQATLGSQLSPGYYSGQQAIIVGYY